MFTMALTLWAQLLVGTPALFESNDTPFTATQFGTANVSMSTSQVHDFDMVDDVDWLVVDPVEGFWAISVLQSMAPPSGSLSFGVAIYDESILTDAGAAPLGTLSDCAPPTTIQNLTISFPDPELYFIRIEECAGLTGGEYTVSLDPVKLDSPFDPVLIRGDVVLSGTATTVPGMYVISDKNSSTISILDGSYALTVTAFTSVILRVVSPDFESSMEFVAGQAGGTTINDVDIQLTEVLDELVFSDGFE